jgi:signal transduction histidine kinase
MHYNASCLKIRYIQKMEIVVFITILFSILILIQYIKIYFRYKKVLSYANELSMLNRKFSSKIKVRTKQLEESFKKEVESIHKAAIMGKVAQPMLHDLATPLSALKGAFLIMNSKNKDEYLIRAEKSVEQIARIVEHARELMLNKIVNTEFKPHALINNVIFVLKDELNRAEIKLNCEVDQNILLNGQPQVFERLIINVLLNAIEELETSNKNNKIILIKLFKSRSYVTFEVEDNGRGIKPHLLNKIFETDFSSKGEGNLGFGLSFVKEAIAKYFGGNIQVKSTAGEYTRFILKFKST